MSFEAALGRRAVVGEPLDGVRRAVRLQEVMLDGGDQPFDCARPRAWRRWWRRWGGSSIGSEPCRRCVATRFERRSTAISEPGPKFTPPPPDPVVIQPCFRELFVAVQPWSGPRSCSGHPPKETLILFRSGLSAGSSTPDHPGA